jgi:anaerobic glycerol-3-phosphate dehydrogenase
MAGVDSLLSAGGGVAGRAGGMRATGSGRQWARVRRFAAFALGALDFSSGSGC